MSGYALTTLQVKKRQEHNKSRHAGYPWIFSDRLWFRPALVAVRPLGEPETIPASISLLYCFLSLFGWTL
jgi:hypothetical protein